MVYDNWDEVIVQWVNCLNITDPIEDVENCKKNDFFWKFLRIISGTTAITDDVNVLEITRSLLGGVYVDFKFNEARTYVDELSRSETIELCLLLMYYACVVERNDELIHPLCQKLPQKTQLCIRKFLERMTIRVTAAGLRSVAEGCTKPSEGDSRGGFAQEADPRAGAESPLRDYLRTPGGSRKPFRRDEEIRKLRAELETERFEKADLEEEVNEHKRRIRMLEGKLKETCGTVSRLRNELYDKENRDLKDEGVSCQLRDTEKCLRFEMETLERYSKQLEEEQSKLQDENEKLIQKLEVSNRELKVWREKANGLEADRKDVLEKYSRQEVELENLRVHCGELTSFLDELRPDRSELETSVVCSPSGWKRCSSICYPPEDLAETIVEVQLRDCRTENAELKELLNESAEKSRALDKELETVKKTYEEANRNCLEMRTENEKLIAKVEELKDSHETIQELLENSQKEVERLTQNQSDTDSMILYLQQSVTQTSELNNQMQTANEELKHELHKVETKLKANEIVLSEKDNVCESLREESKTLQEKYERSVSDFNKLFTQFEVLRKCYDVTMGKFSDSLEKLAKLSEEYKNEVFEDKFEMFETLFGHLRKEKLQSNDMIEKLTVSLNDTEDIVRNLKTVNTLLNDKITLTKDERDKFEKMLETSELHVYELEKTLESKSKEINDISLKISELHNTINELQSLKPKEHNFGKMVDTIINDIKKTKQDYNETISIKDKEIETLNEVNENLTRESVEKEKSHLEKVFVLESEIKDYTLLVQELEASIETSDHNLKIKLAEIEELQNAKVTMRENYEKIRCDLEKKIALTKDTQKKLEIETEIIAKEKLSLETNLKGLREDLNRLELEKSNLIEQNTALKRQYSECFESLNKREREIEERDTIVSDSNKQLLNLKLELELYKQKHKELQAEMDKARQEESKYKFCASTLEGKNKEFESKLQQLAHEKDVLKDVRDNLEKKCGDLERNLESIIAQLSEKNEDLNEYCNQLARCKRENETEIRNVKIALEEARNKLEDTNAEKNDAIRRYDEEIATLKSNLHEANEKIYELNSREISYIREIEDIKSELNGSFQKYTESFNAQQELKLEHETFTKQLTETLHEVVSKCNHLEAENKERTERLAAVLEEQEAMRTEKITLEVKLVNQQKKYNQELENTREQFSSDINNLTHKEKTLEGSLAKALNDLENGRGIRYRLENEVARLTAKLHDIQEEKNYLQQRFQLLEDTKNEVDSEYSQLKLAHEKYIGESDHNLKVREKKLEVDIEDLQAENRRLVNEYLELEKAMENLRETKEIALRKHEQTILNLNTDLKCAEENIASLESLNATIKREQETLVKNTRQLELEIGKRTEDAEKQNALISKLQCAYDILQTGKDRVDLDLQHLAEMTRKAEEEKTRNDSLLDEKLKTYAAQLEKLKIELDGKNETIAEKEKMLADKMRELNELHQVYETMTSEKQSLQERYEQSHHLHKQFLSQIDEENLKAIGDMTFDFMELKVAYQNVYHTLKRLKKEKKKLEKALDEDNLCRKELEEKYEKKQRILDEMANKSLIYENVILEERAKIQDIICELHCAISDLEWVTNEKFETEKQEKSTEVDLDNLKKSRDKLFKTKMQCYKSKEEEIEKTHLDAESLKKELLRTVNGVRSEFVSSKSVRNRLEETIQKERDAKTFLEVKLLNVMNEKTRFEQTCAILYKNVNKITTLLLQKPVTNSVDFGNLSDVEMTTLSEEIERNIADAYRKIHEINESIAKLQKERTSIDSKLDFLENEKLNLTEEKKKLLDDYKELSNEKCLLKEKAKLLEEEVDSLRATKKFELLQNENDVLHQTVQLLKENNIRAYNNYQKFLEISKGNKEQVEKLLKDRNSTETTVNDLKQKLLNLQMKFIHLPQEFLYKRYFDQKESLQVIVDDIQKQFKRHSRISFNIACNFGMLSEKIMKAIFSEKAVEVEAIFKDLEIEETQSKIDELNDLAQDGLGQIGALEKVLDGLEFKSTKVLKENTKVNQAAEVKTDEEYRKKYITIKQKLTLAENVKNNYEKKLKQLREENKKLSAANKTIDDDTYYKTLIQQHVETKEGYEKEIGELREELVAVRNEKNRKEENLEKQLENLREKQRNLEKEMEQKTAASETVRAESNREIETLRDAYGKLMADKSRLESDCTSLKKMYDDRTSQLHEYSLIKEAYEKLLEENNHLITELDTLKFKRNKDKEEYVRLIKRERDEFSTKEDASATKIRTEYESKLEAMKKKMLGMYKEEVDKEMRKVLVEKADNAVLLHTLERYKTDLEDAKKTIEQLKRLNVAARKNDLMLSRESLGSRSVKSECDVRELRTREVVDCPRNGKRSSVHPVRTVVEPRKCMTLPKNMDVIEEDTKNRMVNPADIADEIVMEDEGECFHNKYLADLRENRCVVPSGRESTSSRMSELAWRNSMVPPHLKSSYPAELQMVTPSRYKEEDIKAGVVDLDDSMSTKLLPPDKASTRRKEQGTTSYKKPGPPTPSKNGGRMSLQGQEAAGPLRDSNDSSKTPKRSTPNKIKAFFLGRTSIGRGGTSGSVANAENHPPSPKNKQANKLFRKAW